MASPEDVKQYIADWLQLGKRVLVGNAGEILLASKSIIKGGRYSQEKVVARAIASHKGEVVVEAAVALVDREEQLIPILEAYKLKYPNAIQQLCCKELNQSSNVSDDSNPQGKIIKFETYNKNADQLIN